MENNTCIWVIGKKEEGQLCLSHKDEIMIRLPDVYLQITLSKLRMQIEREGERITFGCSIGSPLTNME